LIKYPKFHVIVCVVEEVNTCPSVSEDEIDGTSACSDAVGNVVGAFKSTIISTSLCIRTDSGIEASGDACRVAIFTAKTDIRLDKVED